MKKLILFVVSIIVLGTAAHAATVCFPFQGCTGTGNAPRAGQVLIGTSTSTYTPAYLNAGSNITISTSSGAITISASGGSGGGTTTTINNVNGPSFIFNVAGNNGLSYSTSTGIITITQATSTASQAGFLSAADWTTFNGKQAAGNYITGLTGDGVASGPGSAAFTLATVNSNIGSFGSSTVVPIITVNAKGLITAVTTTTISGGSGTPGGSDTQVQFNDGGSFGADSRFTWNKAASGGLTVTAPDGAVDPESVGGRIDFYSGNGGDNIAQYYTGAQFSLTGGTGDDQEGGSIGVAAGNSIVDGDGGSVSFAAGNGGATSGSGGSIDFTAGNAQGGDNDGGIVQLKGGLKSGSGSDGYINIVGNDNATAGLLANTAGIGITNLSSIAYLDPSSLTADRIFVFPDAAGTFCLTSTCQATITGGATTIATANLTADRALISSGTGKVAVSPTTATELGYVSGVTSAIQTQLNGKEGSISAGTTAQYWRGDKSFQTLNQAAVLGLTTTDNVTHAGMTVTNSTSTNATSTNIAVTGTLTVPQNKTLNSAGQVTVKNTTSTFNFHDGTAERVLNPERCLAPAWVIENPTATEDIPVMIFNATSTITKVKAVNKTTGDTITFNLGYGASRATATSSLTNVFSSNQTVTATTTISSLSLTGTLTPGTNNILRFYTTAASTSQFTLDVCWRENP